MRDDGASVLTPERQRVIAFSGSPLDRADQLRSDPAALAGLMAHGRLLRLDGLEPRLSAQGTLEWGTLAEAAGDLGVSYRTTAEEAARLRGRLRLRTNAALIKFAVERTAR